jgi:cobalamin-dependent methionine synthase I
VRDTFSASILIKITDAQSQSATKTNVEALGKLIFDAVKGDQIDFGTDWAIRGVKIQSTNYLTQDVGDKVYVQKIYRYSMDIENIS